MKQDSAEEWNKLCMEYERQSSILLEAIKGSYVEPILLDYKQPIPILLKFAVQKMEGYYNYKAYRNFSKSWHSNFEDK